MSEIRKRRIEVSLVLIALCLLISGILIRRPGARLETNWVPMVYATSLKMGTIRTPEFTTNRSGVYEIAINVENKYGIQKMQCLLGATDAHSRQCAGIPSLIDISWTLLDTDRVVATGNSHDFSGLAQSDSLKRFLGAVNCQAGHRYSVVLDIRRDASDLDVANPRIVVQTPYGYFEDYSVGAWIRRVESRTLGLVGIALLVAVALFHWYNRKEAL